jgi:hypothetical protein
VKVGRAALDDDALRRIEAQNPDLEFDWPRILKGGGAPASEPRPPFESRRPRSGVRPRSETAQPERPRSENAQTERTRWEKAQPERPRSEPAQGPRSETAETAQGLTPVRLAPAEPASSEPPADAERGQTPEQFEAAATEERGLTPELPADGTAAHARLGQEGVQRLRQRYADVRARIAERVADPTRRAELTASAERLNPDAWTTPDEVSAGLEQYEAVLASLREVVGRQRRRRRRGSGRRHDGAAEGTPATDAASAEPAETHEDPDADPEPGDFGSDGS